MPHFIESESFVLPSEVKSDVIHRLKETRGIESLEIRLNGDSLEGAREFGVILMALRKRGVRISHEVAIKLEFPRAISRERALSLVENMPKPRNGSVKVRIGVAAAEPDKS